MMSIRLGCSMLGMMLGVVSTQALALETRSYVMSWFVPAMYAHDGDCRALEPVAEAGRGPIDSMYLRILLEQGTAPVEADKILEKLRSEHPADLEFREGILRKLIN